MKSLIFSRKTKRPEIGCAWIIQGNLKVLHFLSCSVQKERVLGWLWGPVTPLRRASRVTPQKEDILGNEHKRTSEECMGILFISLIYFLPILGCDTAQFPFGNLPIYFISIELVGFTYLRWHLRFGVFPSRTGRSCEFHAIWADGCQRKTSSVRLAGFHQCLSRSSQHPLVRNCKPKGRVIYNRLRKTRGGNHLGLLK